MAENTTKDIWNDDDGAKEPPKKRRMLRKFLIFLLVLIAVLGLVLVAAWRDGTGFDALRRYFAYGTEAVGGEKTVYRYDTDNTNRFARVGANSLVILSDTSLRLLGPDGSEVWRGGRWQNVVEKSKTPKSVAFWINTLYSPFTRFSEIAREFMRSKDDPELLHNFTNSWLAEPWEDTKLKTNADLVLERQTETPEWTLYNYM